MDIITNVVDSSKLYKIQKTPYFKRLRLRKESDLVHLRRAQEIIANASKDFLQPQIRQIRLKKLYEQIQETNANNERKMHRTSVTSKTKVAVNNYYRLLQAKIKGNEFSNKNRKSIPLSKIRFTFRNETTNDRDKASKDTSFNKRKEYGQQVSKYNKQNIECRKFIQVHERNNKEFQFKNEQNRKNLYGQYYSIRNRLNLKYNIKEFDEEYSDLLLQCLIFEKEHLDVCGFLEQQVHSTSSIRNKSMSNLTYSTSASSDITIDSCVSDNDLITATSSNKSESKYSIKLCSDANRKLESEASQPSKETFNTFTLLLNSDVDETNKESNDKSSYLNLKSILHKESKNLFSNSNTENKNDEEYENADVANLSKEDLVSSDRSDNEKGLEGNKYEPVDFSSHNNPVSRQSINYINNNKMAIVESIDAASSKEIDTNTFQNESFNEVIENITSQQGRKRKNFSSIDELSNLFLVYGTKTIKKTTSGDVDRNLIKAFALKQQQSIKKALKNIEANNF